MKLASNSSDDLTPDSCRLAMERLQLDLDCQDGQPEPGLSDPPYDTEAHLVSCLACRERAALARLMCATLAKSEPTTVPAQLTERLVSAVLKEHRIQVQRRFYMRTVGVVAALAASLLLVGWLFTQSQQKPLNTPSVDIAQTPDKVVIDVQHAPVVPPLRLGDELAKAGNAIRLTQDSIAFPLSSGSHLVAKLTDQLITPMAPGSEPETAQTGLADIPDATLSGLEPVTSTARKAYSRFIQDVGFVSVKSKS